ncbi:MAG: guanine deaminase [Rhodospirillales bacterium]|nr:guanine deaminase [Rhodospirillales bacterium]
MHAPRRGAIEIVEDAVIVVDDAGRIISTSDARTPDGSAAVAHFAAAERLTTLTPRQFLLPGLVDLHIHAPQFPQLGKALDRPLAEWLNDYTFPLEARFADTAYAAPIYGALVDTLLANGTTTAVYFATRHLEASRLLAEICLAKGQRAIVGRVAQDDPAQCPEYYRDPSPEAAIAETSAFISQLRALPGNGAARILPAITPRFIPACSDALLRGLGDLAAAMRCHIQTHCSESDWEHGFVLDRCGVSDAAALDGFGLLTRRSILAHGNLLSPGDLDRIAGAGAGIAHCPLSNFFFARAVLPVRAALQRGVNVGLGTDIAGGASASLFDSVRFAVVASRALESGVDPRRPPAERGVAGSRIDFAEAFWLATAGGGNVLDLPIGLFRPGYEFDAMIIDPDAPGSNLQVFAEDSGEDVLQKTLNGVTRANIVAVFVAGAIVQGAA